MEAIIDSIFIKELEYDDYYTCVRTNKYDGVWSLKASTYHKSQAIANLIAPIIDNNDAIAKVNEDASISAYMDKHDIWNLYFRIKKIKSLYSFTIFQIDKIESNEFKELYAKEIQLEYINKDTDLLEIFNQIDIVKSLFKYYNAISTIEPLPLCNFYYLRSSASSVVDGSNLLVVTPAIICIERLRRYALLLTSVIAPNIITRCSVALDESAKAAIMSRNMSHNLGSHVMAFLKHKLGSVANILQEENRVLADLHIKQITETLRKQGINPTELELPFLVGLGRFIGYLQERQDYIATVATDYIPYGAPVNMKDSIYDELNPDLRYMRHHKDGDKSQNRPANILMNYIAKSEGLSRENLEQSQKPGEDPNFNTNNDIRLVFEYEGKEVFFGMGDGGGYNSENEALSEMRKFNFNLPGGLVGRQAVFSIIENIIRNAAKHGTRSKLQNLDLKINIIDGKEVLKKDDFNPLRLSIDSQNLFRLAKEDDVKSLYIVKITDNLIAFQSIIGSISKGLEEKYVDSHGKMMPGNKGIKEMRISAAWLRRQPDESLYVRKNDPSEKNKLAPLLLAEWVDPETEEAVLGSSLYASKLQDDKKGHLRYIFCLPKNRFAAVILDGMETNTKDTWKALNKQNPNDWTLYNNFKEFYKNENKSFDFTIVANDSMRKQVMPHTSNRIVTWDGAILPNSNSKGEDKIKEHIYQLYTGIKINDDPIYIWDGKSVDSHGGDNVASGIELCRSENDQNKALYAYRTHHSTENDFHAYWEKKQRQKGYQSLRCVDAVTGDNSSDRLVRREKLDARWYYMHMYALRKRVAIFDERIFRIVHNIDETKFLVGNEDAEAYLKELDAICEEPNNIESLAEKIGGSDLYLEMDQEDAEYIDASTHDYVELKKRLKKYIVRTAKQTGNSLQTIFQKERGVDIYTIIRESPSCFAIVGCQSCEYGNEEHPYMCTFDKIATLIKRGSGYNIEFIDKQFSNHYDYISIHQGILDKIYDDMGIKQDYGAKTHLTECLHSHFMRGAEPIVWKEDSLDGTISEQHFLPRLIIHSGRAKPCYEDMPQKQPFIQYAAIENGIRDCKYSLIELLDYARYERTEDRNAFLNPHDQ